MDELINQNFLGYLSLAYYSFLVLTTLVAWIDKRMLLKPFYRYCYLSIMVIIMVKKYNLFIQGIGIFDVWLLFNTIVFLIMLGTIHGVNMYTDSKYLGSINSLSELVRKIPCEKKPKTDEKIRGCGKKESKAIRFFYSMMVVFVSFFMSSVKADNKKYDDSIRFELQNKAVQQKIIHNKEIEKKDSIIQIQSNFIQYYYGIKLDQNAKN